MNLCNILLACTNDRNNWKLFLAKARFFLRVQYQFLKEGFLYFIFQIEEYIFPKVGKVH